MDKRDLYNNYGTDKTPLNLDVDYSVDQYAEFIMSKHYGRDVRGSLSFSLQKMDEVIDDTLNRQDTVEQQFQDVIENTTDKDVISAPEIIAARNGESNLKARLDKEKQEVTAQLAQTASKKEVNEVNNRITTVENVKANKSYVDDSIGNISTGTPLFADNVAGMTDTSRIYVNLSDGYIYNYVSGAWQSTNQRYQETGIGNDSIGFSNLKEGNIETSNLDKRMLSDDRIELFDYAEVTANKAISSSGAIINATHINLTGLIPMPKDSVLDYTVRGQNGFNVSGRTATSKLAVWNSNGDFIEAFELNNLEGYTATQNCFIRISYPRTETGIKIKNSKTRRITGDVIQVNSIFDYQTDEYIEFYDRTKNSVGKAFSELTGDIIDSPNMFITDFIPLPAYRKMSLYFDGTHWLESEVRDVLSSKIAVYDKDKNWQETLRMNMFNDDLNYGKDKYIRVQVLSGYNNMSVNVSGLKKIDRKYVNSSWSDDIVNQDNGYDVFVFMGQSNMAGRGDDLSIAPDVSDIAYEFRAVTGPTTLHPLAEPFGQHENVEGAIDDGNMKTGSMVSSFAHKYFELTGKKMIGISASQGGTGIQSWLTGTAKHNDVIDRITAFNIFADNNDLKINNIFMVWNQGESDGDRPREEYEGFLNNIIDGLEDVGVKKCMLIRIGHVEHDLDLKIPMITTQTDIARTNERVILIGNMFPYLSKNGYLKDYVHFTQEGYNLQGEQAGINAGYYVNNLKEPTMYDNEFDELYFSFKNL